MRNPDRVNVRDVDLTAEPVVSPWNVGTPRLQGGGTDLSGWVLGVKVIEGPLWVRCLRTAMKPIRPIGLPGGGAVLVHPHRKIRGAWAGLERGETSTATLYTISKRYGERAVSPRLCAARQLPLEVADDVTIKGTVAISFGSVLDLALQPRVYVPRRYVAKPLPPGGSHRAALKVHLIDSTTPPARSRNGVFT